MKMILAWSPFQEVHSLVLEKWKKDAFEELANYDKEHVG